MILFWLSAALLSAGAAALILRGAARARGADPRASRPALIVCFAAPLAGAGLYFLVGSPGAPDQPYEERVEAWRAAPESLGPAEAAAVLERIVDERSDDPLAHTQLGRARLAAGDAFGAVSAFEQAAMLAPGQAQSWTALAQGLLALEPPSTSEARRALAQARAIAPDDLEARYWTGRTAIAEGDTAAGLAEWSALAAALPEGDPRREALQTEIASVGSAPAPDAAIEGMVAGLAERLRRNPNDPAGWARLARAYAVLRREEELRATLTEARRLFSGRPEVLRNIEAGAAEGRARAPLRAGG